MDVVERVLFGDGEDGDDASFETNGIIVKRFGEADDGVVARYLAGLSREHVGERDRDLAEEDTTDNLLDEGVGGLRNPVRLADARVGLEQDRDFHAGHDVSLVFDTHRDVFRNGGVDIYVVSVLLDDVLDGGIRLWAAVGVIDTVKVFRSGIALVCAVGEVVVVVVVVTGVTLAITVCIELVRVWRRGAVVGAVRNASLSTSLPLTVTCGWFWAWLLAMLGSGKVDEALTMIW